MELKMINGKYWGDNKIEGVTLSDRKTYLGKLIYKLTFDSGNFEEVTEENIGIGMTDEKSDASSLRNRLIDKMTEKIMGIMLEGEIKIGDVEYLKSKITGNVNFHQKRAEDILWGKDIYDINLADINKIVTNQKNGRSSNNNTKAKDASDKSYPGKSA